MHIPNAFLPVIEAIKQNVEAELHPLYLPDYTEGVNSTKHTLGMLLRKLDCKGSSPVRVTLLLPQRCSSAAALLFSRDAAVPRVNSKPRLVKSSRDKLIWRKERRCDDTILIC